MAVELLQFLSNQINSSFIYMLSVSKQDIKAPINVEAPICQVSDLGHPFNYLRACKVVLIFLEFCFIYVYMLD
jgi:hypothetical protein